MVPFCLANGIGNLFLNLFGQEVPIDYQSGKNYNGSQKCPRTVNKEIYTDLLQLLGE